MAYVVRIINTSGSTLSASSGTQYIPLTQVFEEGGAYTVNGTSAISATNAGPHQIHAMVTIDPTKFVTNDLILDVRENGFTSATHGYGQLDRKKIVYQPGENKLNKNRATLDKTDYVTLKGSTIVSASALDQIGVYLTGSVASTTITATVSVEELNG